MDGVSAAFITKSQELSACSDSRAGISSLIWEHCHVDFSAAVVAPGVEGNMLELTLL